MATVLTFTVVLGMAGCGEKEAGSVAPEGNSAAVATLEPAPPSLTDLQAALNLTAAQSASLATPLRNWERAHEEMTVRIRNDEGDGFGPEYGLGGTIEPPHFRFLEECTPLLTREQIRRLARYLEERREHERRRLTAEGMHPGPGIHLLRIVGALRDEFSLTREQLADVYDAFRAALTALRSLHTDYVDGTITAEGVRDGVTAALDTLKADLQTTLSPEGYARLTELLNQARTVVAQRLLDTLDTRTDRHVAFLTLVLGLDDAQHAAVVAAFETARASTEALLIEVRNGTVAFPEAIYRHIQIHESLRAALHATLTPEQIDTLRALRPLMRHDPPLPIYF